jgi:hypothetical protein
MLAEEQKYYIYTQRDRLNIAIQKLGKRIDTNDLTLTKEIAHFYLLRLTNAAYILDEVLSPDELDFK